MVRFKEKSKLTYFEYFIKSSENLQVRPANIFTFKVFTYARADRRSKSIFFVILLLRYPKYF